MTRTRWIAWLAALIALAACGPRTPTPASRAVNTPVALLPAASATLTSAPTSTPTPHPMTIAAMRRTIEFFDATLK